MKRLDSAELRADDIPYEQIYSTLCKEMQISVQEAKQ